MAKQVSGNYKLRKKIYLDALNYYRVHPDEFCEDVVGIRLNLYQCIMMRCAFKYNYTSFIMCRGLGKTWLSMLIIVLYCLLNENILGGVIAPSFRQAKQALQEKYKDSLCQLSPFIAQEEENFVCSVQQAYVKFYNNSKITAYPLGSDGAKIRGARLNIVLVDEAAYVPRFIYEKVIKPMLIVKSNYKVGQEQDSSKGNKIILASTASYRACWLYEIYCDWTRRMLDGDDKYFTMTLPYTVGIRCGLLDENIVEDAKRTMIESEFQQEYEGIFPKLIDGSWIKYDDLISCSDLEHIETKGVPGYDYVMSVDVARVSGQDNTIIMVFKLRWSASHVDADLVYVKGINGAAFSKQAEEIRAVLRNFPNVIRIYQDTQTIGQGLSDELAKDFYYDVEDKWYPPLIDMNDEEAMKNIDKTHGVPIIYGIRATAEFNHNMGYAVKNFTEKGWLHMYSMKTDEEKDLNIEEQLLIHETEAAKLEILNMEAKPLGSGWMQFFTKSKRKDRWSAMCMGIWGIDLIRKEREAEKDNQEALFGVSFRN